MKPFRGTTNGFTECSRVGSTNLGKDQDDPDDQDQTIDADEVSSSSLSDVFAAKLPDLPSEIDPATKDVVSISG